MVFKYLQTIRYIPIFLHPQNISLSKAFHSDKKKIVLDSNVNIKKQNRTSLYETLKPEAVDEIEKNAFDIEEELTQVVLTEKEKDASVRSRLSKECNALLADKNISLTGSSGLNLHLESKISQHVGWENYEFGTTMETRKKQGLTSVLMATCKDSSGITGTPQAAPSGPPSGSPPGLVNRIKRGEPGKVIFCLIPEEWWKFFIPKTGVTGFWTFLFTFGTFLVSKEYYVLEHNYYGGLSTAVLWYFGIKYVGPMAANYLDKGIDAYEKEWQKSRDNEKENLQQILEDELLAQFQSDGQLILMEAKRENVALQLEDEFRKRQMHVFAEVKKRLDYHVAIAMAHRKIVHKNLVEYVTREVQKSITPDMQKDLIDISIQNIVSEFEKGSE